MQERLAGLSSTWIRHWKRGWLSAHLETHTEGQATGVAKCGNPEEGGCPARVSSTLAIETIGFKLGAGGGGATPGDVSGLCVQRRND